jgi:hypothetical protein
MQVRFSSQIKLFPKILTIFRKLMNVGDQNEGSETMREKEDALNSDNSDTETVTTEDVSDKDNDTRRTVNSWRDSGYISSDCEDSNIKQFEDNTETSSKNQERIASIFWF